MTENKPDTLNDVAKALNLIVHKQNNFLLDLYVLVQPEKLLETIIKLKEEYGATHLSTIIVQEQENSLNLLYPLSINLKSNQWAKLILDVNIDKNEPKIDSIIDIIPGAILYEREAYDMFGIKFNNHPDLRRLLTPEYFPKNLYPLRKEFTYEEIRKKIAEARKERDAERHLKNYIMREYSDYIPEKSDYSISVGPQHPSREEPVRFVFNVKGETVESIDYFLGFNHRGIEKAFETRTWLQNLYLVERICGICSNSHQLSYCQTIEKCANTYATVPERAQYIRVIMAELERIHSHLLWYGVLAHDTGFDTMFHYTWRDREIIMDILEEISGNRVNYAMNTIFGVRRDISKDQRAKIVPKLKDLYIRVQEHQKLMLNERSFITRQKGIAILTKDDALRFCAVGPNARASGINIDIRRDDPYAAYDQLSFDVPILTEGDIFSSLIIRLEETLISIDLVIQALENMALGDLKVKTPNKIPLGEAICRVEAPRGENIHYLQSDGSTKPVRYKVRAPTLANIPSLVERLIGVQVADIPPVIRVIDPCIGCMDRVTFIDLKTNKRIELSNNQLISRANRAYRSGTKVLDF